MSTIITFNTEKSNSVMLHIVALVLIYISGAAITSIDAGANIGRILNVVIYIFGLYCIVRQFGNFKIDIKMIVLLCMTILFGAICSINYMPSIVKVIKRLILFMIFFLIAKYIEIKRIPFEKYLYDVVLWFAYIALAFFTIINIFRIDLPHGVLTYGTNAIDVYNNYLHIFFTGSNYFTGNILGIQFYRLQGIFWEPGVFAVYLNLALYYYFFCLKEKKKVHMVILLIDIILTVSTTGLCVATVLVGAYLIERIHGIRSKIMIFVPIAFLVTFTVTIIWLQKKNLSNSIWSSYALRTNDLINSLKLWKSHFLFGTGFNNTGMFQGTIENRGSSNGLLTWCYTTGLIGTVVIFYPMIGNIIRYKGKRIICTLFLGTFIAINMTEPLINSYFMIYLVARIYSIFLYRNGGKVNGFNKSKNYSYSAEIF